MLPPVASSVASVEHGCRDDSHRLAGTDDEDPGDDLDGKPGERDADRPGNGTGGGDVVRARSDLVVEPSVDECGGGEENPPVQRDREEGVSRNAGETGGEEEPHHSREGGRRSREDDELPRAEHAARHVAP